IPRTLALAAFGDLDVSTIRTRPEGRGRLVTRITAEEKFPQVLEFMARELTAGRQAFVVVPLIEEGGRLEARAAEAEYARLTVDPILRPFRLGLLPSRLKPEEKRAAQERVTAG